MATMVAEAVEQEVGITLPPLKLETMHLPLMGDTPLIVHAWSEKAKKAMLGKQMKEAATAKSAKNPKQDFEGSLYRLDGGRYGFPSVAFKSAAVTACTSVSGITKIAARQAFRVVGEPSVTRSAFNGSVMRNDLVQIIGPEPEMREDAVRIQKTTDIRYRGQFWPWMVELEVLYNRNVLSVAQIVNLFNTAGFAVGIGEWRMEKSGEFGAFHVASSEEAARFKQEHA